MAAVAGKDFVLIASDTRLTDGGYGVHSRRYLSGRLWSASSSISSGAAGGASLSDHNIALSSEDSGIISRSDYLLPSSAPSTNKCSSVPWDSDGSLLLPSSIQCRDNVVVSRNTASQLETTTSSSCHPTISVTNNPPIIVGSAGCASDCESLKRRMRLELDALLQSSSSSVCEPLLSASSVANLLQQILYSRRGFPFYSFCVLAGLETVISGRKRNDEVAAAEGAVYVYDAIGSYERVAVGSAGTGRELLQPILDQLFSSGRRSISDADVTAEEEDGRSSDIMAIPPAKQRVGVAGSLRPPVLTTVRCTLEDAVKNVARAYQSVAEREISVGDEVVICVVQSATIASSSAAVTGRGRTTSEGAVLKVYRYPLKKH